MSEPRRLRDMGIPVDRWITSRDAVEPTPSDADAVWSSLEATFGAAAIASRVAPSSGADRPSGVSLKRPPIRPEAGISAAPPMLGSTGVAVKLVLLSMTLGVLGGLGIGALAFGARQWLRDRSARHAFDAHDEARLRVDATDRLVVRATEVAAPLASWESTCPPAEHPKPARTLGQQRTNPLRVLTPAEEASAVVRARRAIRSGQPRRGLSILGDLDRDIGVGALGPERHVLWVEALLASGRNEAARDAARAYLRDHPTGAFRDRMRAVIESSAVGGERGD